MCRHKQKVFCVYANHQESCKQKAEGNPHHFVLKQGASIIMDGKKQMVKLVLGMYKLSKLF